ncbi:MAG: hypothetical protein JW741_12515 [Sedimentisphaerales bacterium]|nr:hypothetical protein [Sedimentisphaerales bacterium]
MGVRAGEPLTPDEAQRLLNKLERAASMEACWSCECLQGFITQLELDAAEDSKPFLETYEVRHERLHGCLGCRPCAPADLYAEYLKMR